MNNAYKEDRCYVLRQLAQQACHLPGNFAECGVYKRVLSPTRWLPLGHTPTALCTLTLICIKARDCCAFFYERLSPGGVMIFHDYGFEKYKRAAKKAVDELP